MPGSVDRRVTARDHVAADVVEPIDRLVDSALVARDRRRREHDRVAVVQLDRAVVVVRHPTQGRERLALRASGDHDDLVVGPVLDLAGLDQHPVGDLDVPQRAADADVLAHRASHQRDLAPERGGRVHHLLHAMDVGRKTRDDHAPRSVRERLLQVRADPALRRRETRTVRVGRVAAQQQDPVAPQFGQPRDVSRQPVDRGLVELVVPRQQHRPQLGGERHRTRVGNRMSHVHELELERAERDALAWADVLQRGVAQTVLVELGARHRDRQPPAVDRRPVLELAQHPRQRAQVILVPVGDHDRLDVLGALAQVGEVREHQVDPQHLGGREPQPRVDDDDPAVVLDDRHVLADLAQAAERQDPQLGHPARAAASRPWRSRRAVTVAVSCSSSSTYGSRGAPTRIPSKLSAALTVVAIGAIARSR